MPKYDVAIIGAGLGGLAAAALLSAQKKKIIVLERSESLHGAVGAYARDGFSFCASPALSYGFDRGGAFHELSAKLGIAHSVSVQSPCYQVALPDHRVSLFPDQGETLEELRREFPGEIPSLKKFYRDLHRLAEKMVKSRFSAFVTRRRSAGGFIRGYRFSRELTAFFDIQSLYFFHRPVAHLSLVDLITLCDSPPFHLAGGFTKLADELYAAVVQQDGNILYNRTVDDFASRGNAIVGITTGSEVIEADTILLNPARHSDSSTIFIGLRDAVVPVGMYTDVLYLPDYQSPRDYYALSLGAKDDLTSAPKDMRALSLSIRSEQSGPVDKQKHVDRLNRLIPFLNDHIVFCDKHRADDEGKDLTKGVTFKPLRSGKGTALLFRGSKRNLYLLNNAQTAPLQVMSAVNTFVKKVD